MSKAYKRRRNGKVIQTRPIKKRVITKEAKDMIKRGDSSELYDDRGKIKKKYTQLITINTKHHV